MTDRGDERIGDAERQHVIDLLRTHTGAGRLTLDEFSDLVGDVFAARTRAELEKVLDGLPPGVSPGPIPDVAGPVSRAPGLAAAAPASRAPVPSAPRPGVPAPRPQKPKRLVAIMSGRNTRGRWRAPAEITAFAFWGGVKVDLRSAVIESPVIDVYAWAIMGSVDVVVPPGILVELDGLVLMGGNEDRTRGDTDIAGAPLVRVHARGMWGSVQARHGRDRSRGRHAHSLGHGHGVGRADTPEVEDSRPAPPALPGPPIPDWISIPPVPRLPHEMRRPSRRRDRSYDRTNGERDRAAPVVGTGAAGAASAAAGPRGTLTMMVTDIVGSTRLAEEIGDRRWMDVLAAHNSIVRDAVAHHGGTEIKAQGDGFLLVFSSARSAILAAVDVQQKLAVHRQQHPDQALDLRIGLHTGEIVDVDGDVFGQNVVIAVRIADHAAPGEILVSGLTRDLTQAGGDLEFDPGRELDLKGLSQPWRVHRVTWTPAPA
jgi:class 3 adenylate cyclase